MGSKSKSQTVGYTYFGSLMVVIGNRIETMLGIRPDNTKWIEIIDPELPQNIDYQNCVINEPNLFGGDNKEGGWEGYVDLQCGHPEPLQNEHLKNQLGDIISSYPYLSYLVYHGKNNKGFKLVSMSGVLKEVLYWPKRTRVRNDGREQWYKSYVHHEKGEIIVCEIESFISHGAGPDVVPNISFTVNQTAQAFVGNTKVLENNIITEITGYLPGSPISFDGILVGSGAIDNELSADMIFSISSPGKYYFYLVVRAGFNPFNLFLQLIYDESIIIERDSRIIDESTKYTKWEVILYATNSCNIKFHAKSDKIWEGGLYVNDLAFLHSREDTHFKIFPYKPSDITYEEAGIDINPIHKIREILTDDTAMGLPESLVNDENFKFAANRIWDEGLGISWAVTEKSCKEALDELCYHIEAGLRVNRQTGKYEVILFRDDLWNLNDAIIFSENNIKSFACEIVNSDEIINSSNISFYDRHNIKSSSFSLENNGLLKSVNKQNSNKLEFPYFMNKFNAEKVGNWKLKQLSTPLRKGSFTTGIKQARKLNRYDTFLLSWSNQRLVNLPCIIMKIILGDGIDNTVTIHWVELVKFSSLYYPPINTDQSLSPEGQSPAPVLASVYELTYYEAVMQQGQVNTDNNLTEFPEVGFLCAVAKRGQNNSLNAELHTRLSTASEYTMANLLDYTECSLLQSSINKTDNEIHIINAKDMPVDSLLKLGNEILSLVSTDVDNNIITVQRGCLDTIPQEHAMGSVLWYIDDFNAVDPTSYVLGDVVNAKVLTTTPSDKLRLVDTPTLSLDIQARPIRPYPPANVKINDEYWPAEISDGVNLSWNHRNRVQQTGGTFISWFDGSVTIENGTTYQLEIFEIDNDNNETEYLNVNVGTANFYDVDLSSLLVSTVELKINLYSIRDGFNSYQKFEHIVLLPFSAPYNLTAVFSDD